MIEIKDFRQLIQHIAPKTQSFTIKYENWKGTPQDVFIKSLFDTNNNIEINRYDIFRESELKKKVILTLLWGYPTKGRGNNMNRLLEGNNFNALLDLLSGYRKVSPTIKKLKSDTSTIKGLGIATMTKFIYFLGLEVEGYKSLILDQRVMDCYNNKRISALAVDGAITNQNGWKYYKQYIKQMSHLARQLHTQEDQLEIFIFMFGNNLKAIKL